MMHTVLGIVVLVSCFVHDSTTELQEDKAMNVQGLTNGNDGKISDTHQKQDSHDETMDEGKVILLKRSTDLTCRPVTGRKPLNFLLQLEAVDIMRGHLATALLLDGAILLKETHNCKLYWKKGNLLSASGEFDMIFSRDVKTMLLPQGVVKEGMLGDRIIIMRTDTVTSTAEITLKLLMFEITIRIKYARSMTGLSFGSIYPDSDSRGHH